MKRPAQCQARHYGDQIICAACGLNWDANDTEPPTCRTVDLRTKQVKALGKFETSNVESKVTWRMPYALPNDVAQEMAKVFRASCVSGDANGMHAAYRLLLDRMGS